jgi:hypothetical protein
MSYFLDKIIKNVSIACHMASSDPYISRSIMKGMMDRYSPKDEEVVMLMEKMIFVSLDSPVKFKNTGIKLIKVLKDKEKEKNQKKNKK